VNDSTTSAEHNDDANAQLARLMGLVLALRFLSWGGALAGACAVLLVESLRHPGLLSYLTLPVLLAFYLLSSGQVLLLVRLAGWPTKALALGPLVSLALICLPAARSSPKWVGLALALGLWLYLGGFVRQAQALNHPRAAAWFGRWRLAILPSVALAVAVPGAAAPAGLFGGMLALGALLAGWRIWLAELRQSIAERENV
jgi:hypothetical protein